MKITEKRNATRQAKTALRSGVTGVAGVAGLVSMAVMLGIAIVCPGDSSRPVVMAIGQETSNPHVLDTSPDNSSDGVEEQNAGIELYAAGTSLAIDNPSLQTTLKPGETGYLASNVTYDVTDANYTLQVSYANGKSSLTNGEVTLNGAGTGGVAGSSMGDNTWGFAWGSTSDTNSSMKYYTMPAYNTSGTGISTGRLENGTTNVSSTTKKIVFAAKFASSNTSSGHYTTQVLLSLVATPKYTYTLSYNANNGSGAPTTQTYTTTATSYAFTISSTKPTRTGYVFLGWGNAAGDATASYQPGGSITLQSSAASKTLYAIWGKTYTLTYNANNGSGAPSSQTCTTTGTSTSCSITMSSTKPTRMGYTFLGWGDNSTDVTSKYTPGTSSITLSANKTIYAVWQQPTLKTITNMQDMTAVICAASSDSDTATLKDIRDNITYTVKKIGSLCWMTQNLRIVNKAITPADSDVSADFTVPASSTNGFLSYTTPNVYYANNTTYGAYYSWCAATAGSCAQATTANVIATDSICPKGWRLPTKEEYVTVADSYANYDFALAGSMGHSYPAGTGVISGDGSLGMYWSSTSGGNSLASYFYRHSSGATVTSAGTSSGYSVRCVAR